MPALIDLKKLFGEYKYLFVISYDLDEEDKATYDAVEEKIESLGEAKHMQRSVWLLLTTSSPEDVETRISKATDSNDSFFAAPLDISEELIMHGLDDFREWLQKLIRND
jgi:hypothetical protein